MSELPIVCTLLPKELNERRAELLPGLVQAAARHESVEDGYRFYFNPSSEMFAHIARVIDAERQCCAFSRFQLTVEEAGGPFRLEITGPTGTVDFLRSLIAL